VKSLAIYAEISNYINQIKAYFADKVWLQPGF